MTIQPTLALLFLVIASGGFFYTFWQLQHSRILLRVLNSQRITNNSAIQKSRSVFFDALDCYLYRNSK